MEIEKGGGDENLSSRSLSVQLCKMNFSCTSTYGVHTCTYVRMYVHIPGALIDLPQ